MQGSVLANRRGFSVNPQGRLEFGGCDVVSLAGKFGTPLYVVNEDIIRSNARKYLGALSAHYPYSGVIYAGKAFLPTWMCRVVYEEGLCLDVASGGELYTALKAGFPAERIFFHGNNKSFDEIRMGLGAGVGRFVVDNWLEIDMLSSLAKNLGKRPDVLVRVSPGVEAHTHVYIETGQIDCKFGFGLHNDAAFAAVETILKQDVLTLRGLHCHIGSQITALEGPLLAARRMVGFMARLKEELGYEPEELNLGGGLGINYTSSEAPPSIESYVKALCTCVVESVKKQGNLGLPRLYLEPGRSLVGEAGITLYTVGSKKHIPGVRTYVSVDGGMGDNPRPALYDAVYELVLADRPLAPPNQTVCIAGKHCETDVLLKEAWVPDIETGDTVAVLCTGAYCYSMASNYNALPRPAVVAVSKGKPKLVVKRQSYEDLLAFDVPEERVRRFAAPSGLPAATLQDG